MIVVALMLQSAELNQADYDRDGARMAAHAASSDWTKTKREPLDQLRRTNDRWRVVTRRQIRASQAFAAPSNYRYHTFAKADLDRDGRIDLVEFVDSGSKGAIRVTFGDHSKMSRIIAEGGRFIGGQGLFAAGRHAVMVNFPESRAMFLFMHDDQFFASFLGD